MNDEYTKEEMEKTGNYVYGGKRHDAICDELEKSGYTELEINLVSIGVWKGIESERNKSQEEIKRLKEENNKLRKALEEISSPDVNTEREDLYDNSVYSYFNLIDFSRKILREIENES